MTITEILGSGEYTSAIGLAIIFLSVLLFSRLLDDRSDSSTAQDDPSASVDDAAITVAISAAVAEYRKINP
jgi:hypothetical protein